MGKMSSLDFDEVAYAWRPDVDNRPHSDLYRVGKGEQSVLIYGAYKGELVPLWRFKAPEIAAESSRAIYRAFLAYLRRKDFVGADIGAEVPADGLHAPVATRITGAAGSTKRRTGISSSGGPATRSRPSRRRSSTMPGERPRRSRPTPASRRSGRKSTAERAALYGSGEFPCCRRTSRRRSPRSRPGFRPPKCRILRPRSRHHRPRRSLSHPGPFPPRGRPRRIPSRARSRRPCRRHRRHDYRARRANRPSGDRKLPGEDQDTAVGAAEA